MQNLSVETQLHYPCAWQCRRILEHCYWGIIFPKELSMAYLLESRSSQKLCLVKYWLDLKFFCKKNGGKNLSMPDEVAVQLSLYSILYHIVSIHSFVPYLFPQPIIGSVGSRRQGTFSGTEDLQLGMLAAVYTYDEASRPWLGEIQAIEDSNMVKVHWYVGSYSKSWKPMSGTNSTSSIHRESLLLWGFSLTEKSHRLKSETVAELKRLYQETDNQMAN